MKTIVEIPLQDGFVPVFRILEKYSDLSNTNCGGIIDHIEKKVNEASVNDIKEYKFFNHLDKNQLGVEIDADIYPYIRTNHNGYTVFWTTDKEYALEKSVLSIDEYRTWRDSHVARWIDDKWVYIKKESL
jgi:hypothetical protein